MYGKITDNEIGMSKIQFDANKYIVGRLLELRDMHFTFSNSLESKLSREDAYKELISLMGRTLADLATLSEVISEKDEKNIFVGGKQRSLNTIMRRIPIVFGISMENVNKKIIVTSENKRRYYFDYTFPINSIAKLFSTRVSGSFLHGDYTTEADNILIDSLEKAYCHNLQELHKIDFIKNNRIEEDSRRRIDLKRCVTDIRRFHGFLNHFYSIVYSPDNILSKFKMSEYHWEYLPRHSEKSYLSDEGCRVLADILSFYPQIFEHTVKHFDEIEECRIGNKLRK